MKLGLKPTHIITVTLLVMTSINQTLKSQERSGISSIGGGYSFEHLGTPSTFNRHFETIEAGYKFLFNPSNSELTLLPRINFGQFVDSNNTLSKELQMQYQLEAYYSLMNKRLAFVGMYSYSPSNYLAHHFAFIEGTFQIAYGWGIIGGIKLISWDKAIFSYTLGVEKYIKNYWISLKPTLIFENNHAYASYNLGVRRFGNNERNYQHLGLVYGNSFEYINVRPDLREIMSLDSYGVLLMAQQQIISNLYLRPALYYRYEEYINNSFRSVWGGALGFAYYF